MPNMSAAKKGSERTGAERGADPKPDADDLKRRFREALDAKHGREGEDHLDYSPPASAHGPVDAKRVFRRKTG